MKKDNAKNSIRISDSWNALELIIRDDISDTVELVWDNYSEQMRINREDAVKIKDFLSKWLDETEEE